jgi:hypothetical protein
MKTRGQRESQKQERQAGVRFGGKTTIGSGNGWTQKNDVRTKTISMELKFTDKKSFSLKLEDLLIAERHALLDGRESLFGVRMGSRDWWILSDESFQSLLHGDAPADPSP